MSRMSFLTNRNNWAKPTALQLVLACLGICVVIVGLGMIIAQAMIAKETYTPENLFVIASFVFLPVYAASAKLINKNGKMITTGAIAFAFGAIVGGVIMVLGATIPSTDPASEWATVMFRLGFELLVADAAAVGVSISQ